MTNNIIPLFKPFHAIEPAVAAYRRVLESGFTGQGPENAKFEKALQEWMGIDYLATTNSATSGEHLVESLLRVPSGKKWPGLKVDDEVLTTGLTCLATQTPWEKARYKLKWVDIDPQTLNLDLDDLARKVSAKTRVIVLVHWGGYPVDLDRVRQIQDTAYKMYGIRPVVVEDCAHALKSKYKGKYLGHHGNICTFSLQSIKHLTSGDGGFVTFPHRELFSRGKNGRWYGIDRETDKLALRCDGDVEETGSKWHMNDIASSLGLANLPFADYVIGKYKDNAAYYDKSLQGISGIQLLKREEGYESAHWIYSFLVEDRPNFIAALKDKGIFSNQVHERNDGHTCFKEFQSQLPTLDKIMHKVVAIPVGWWVEEKEREFITSIIKKGW